MNSLSIVQGTNDKPGASRALIKFFSECVDFSGELFIGYPIISTSDGGHAIDAILISPDKGVIIFDLVEGSSIGNYNDRQDDSANKLIAKLQNHKELMRRRELLVDIHTVTLAPAVLDVSRFSFEDYPIANLSSLKEKLNAFRWPGATETVYKTTLSVLQSISTIRKNRASRLVVNEDSRGGKLKRLEDSIATLDNLQSKAVIETVHGVQRIRGLAGSGKTIVLALKAAYLHKQHPEWRIAVTFNTRSLKGQFRRHIQKFCIEGGEEPNWLNLRILNAWGAPGGGEREGIYHEYCRAHEIEYLDLKSARSFYGRNQEFAGACSRALDQVKDHKSLYNVILIDEAQDFPPSFLRLCYSLLDENKRLVYAYDELQNLTGNSLPSPEDIFGKGSDDIPLVRLDVSDPDSPKKDIILDCCYRNSKPVLTTAHSLGFGIYRTAPKGSDTGLVQMFEHPQLWEEIGYQVKSGSLSDGNHVVLERTEKTSPSFLEKHSNIDDLVQFVSFESEEEQTNWVFEAIKKNVVEEELRCDDIIVINPDPITTRDKVGSIRKLLNVSGIQSHIAGVDTDPDIFFNTATDSITFTGIYRAKGNEAGMVYIINAQDCESAWNLSNIRNRIFTAITRSKAWVRVVGIGPSMLRLKSEYDCLYKNNFELRFKYPTKKEREKLMIVHRDMTASERKKIESRQDELAGIVEDLKTGKIHIDDLPKSLIDELSVLINQRKADA